MLFTIISLFMKNIMMIFKNVAKEFPSAIIHILFLIQRLVVKASYHSNIQPLKSTIIIIKYLLHDIYWQKFNVGIIDLFRGPISDDSTISGRLHKQAFRVYFLKNNFYKSKIQDEFSCRD